MGHLKPTFSSSHCNCSISRANAHCNCPKSATCGRMGVRSQNKISRVNKSFAHNLVTHSIHCNGKPLLICKCTDFALEFCHLYIRSRERMIKWNENLFFIPHFFCNFAEGSDSPCARSIMRHHQIKVCNHELSRIYFSSHMF